MVHGSCALSVYVAWAEVHLAFYAQRALPDLAHEFFLGAFLAQPPAGELLFVGSYSAMLPERLAAPLVLCDLNAGMLHAMQRRRPDAQAVLADVRKLPFHERFSCICMPGAVTAHLLDDLALNDALEALSTALLPGGTLYLDAYLPEIVNTDYFSGHASFHVDAESWTRIARIAGFDTQSGLLQVDLQFVDPQGRSVCNDRLIQRCYSAAVLAKACTGHSLRLQDCFADTDKGRLYLALQRDH
ncbi:class I SAM-dependent methyltransferase [Azohydromonas lata]|uniref:Class I SAM-dependent methyltransferase n=1 Tax=Azohydromonas lata TaxID=45677 RepID=A0ABU5IS28_9BURK|nr:class I SAM-dependent methyltransferase [Azohydromonas lata]MDZ5461686.1 class I SAM-dependent methyltransferase [Azohydromonas lata]